MRPRIAMLSTAFRAFHDLHRAGYHAYAAARLPHDEAALAVAHTFGLVAADWPAAVARRNPAAYAWHLHTRYVSAVVGAPVTRADDARLLHESLHLSVDRIATLTGSEPAAVTALLASARRADGPGAAPSNAPDRRFADFSGLEHELGRVRATAS